MSVADAALPKAKCGDCGEDFVQTEAYVCQQTPGLKPPIGEGVWPSTAYCPSCGALVAEGYALEWTGNSKSANKGRLNAFNGCEIPRRFTPLHEERRLDVAGVREFEQFIKQRGGYHDNPAAAKRLAYEAGDMIGPGDNHAAVAKLDEAVAAGLSEAYQARLLGEWGSAMVANADRDDIATVGAGVSLCERSMTIWLGASWQAPYVVSLVQRAKGEEQSADTALADARRFALTEWWVQSSEWALNDRVSRWVAATH